MFHDGSDYDVHDLRTLGHTEETRAKMSAKATGRKHSDETRAKMSATLTGKKVSDETRAKISATLKGRKVSDETRAKRVGRKHSEETRAKISAKATGRKHSDETRAKMVGRKHSDETRAKLSAIASKPKVKVTYHTPYGVFANTISAAQVDDCSSYTIRSRCKSERFPEYYVKKLDNIENHAILIK